jgi:hypothetical protein
MPPTILFQIGKSPMKMLPLVVLVLAIILPCKAIPEMQEEKGTISLWSKGSTWVLQFPGEGYKLQLENHKDDGLSHYYSFHNAALNLNVSFYIEPVSKCTSSEECRRMYWENPGPAITNPQGVTFIDLNDFSIVEFIVPEFKGIKVNQINMTGHHVREGYWVDVHISKVFYQPGDRDVFIDFINSITFKSRRVTG